MQYIISIFVICLLSAALCNPHLKKRDDEDEDYEEKQDHKKSSLFGGDQFFSSRFQELRNLMRSVSEMFTRQIESASNMMHNWGKGIGFNFNMDITANSTVNSSESHTEQVGNNYVITNITRLDKVDQQGKKYRIINKNVRVKPVNGSEDILNSDRTYVIMEPEKIQKSNFKNSKENGKEIPEHRYKIEPSVVIDKSPSVVIDKSPSVITEASVGEKETIVKTFPESTTKKQWEILDPNVMFDSKRNQVVTDLERNEV